MPDISMCTWGECPIGNDCLRLQAKPDEYQVRCDFSVEYNEKTKKCNFQIPLEKRRREPHGN